MAGALPLRVSWGLFGDLPGASGTFRAPSTFFQDGFRMSLGAKGPLREPPRVACTFLGLCCGLLGSLASLLSSQIQSNTIKTIGFSVFSLCSRVILGCLQCVPGVLPGTSDRSLGSPWQTRAHPRVPWRGPSACSEASWESRGASLVRDWRSLGFRRTCC